ncbi:MAG: fibronectin type III domain-containing protein [Elusimicrobia bacterium]|nr:fibronectin type III domain-containing protein [Elusimicrobiota bacterium]
MSKLHKHYWLGNLCNKHFTKIDPLNLRKTFVPLARITGFSALFMVVLLISSNCLASDLWVDEFVNYGRVCPLALDSNDRPSSAFHDSASRLVYTKLNGSKWETEIFQNEEAELVDMALDALDRPHIVYKRARKLKWAQWTGASWDITMIDNEISPGGDLKIALHSDGKPRIVFYDEENESLVYIEWTGAKWSKQTIDRCYDISSLSNFDLAVDNNGNPHITYSGVGFHNGPSLKYAVWTGIQWSTQTVDNSHYSGANCSIDLDSKQRPHIVSFNYGSDSLIYAWWDGTIWQLETITKNIYVYSVSLALDAENNPHIGFLCNDNRETFARYAHKSRDVWSVANVKTGLLMGDYTSIAINSRGRPRILNQNQGGIRYAMLVTTPVVPSVPVPFEVGSSSIVWTWEDASDEELGYRTRNTSDNADLSKDLPRGTTSWVQKNLGPNSPNSIYAEAFNAVADSASPPSRVTYTRAAIPRGLAFNQLSVSSASLVWNAGGNPTGTSYGVEISSEGTPFTEFVVAQATGTWAVGLSPGTRYSFRVRAYNGDNLPTGYSTIISTYISLTSPLAPSFSIVNIQRSTDTIIWFWGDVSNELGFRIIRGTDGVNISGDLPANTTSWIQTGLMPSTTYQIQIEAFNSVGSSRTSVSFSDRQVSTLANPPKGFKVTGLYRSGISLSWLTNNNPEWTTYELQMSLDGTSFTALPDNIRGDSVSISNLLTGTTYYFRIRAMSQDRFFTEFDTPLMGTTRNRIDPNGGVIIETTPHGNLLLNISSGTFSSFVELDIQTPLSFPNPNSPVYHLSPTGIGFQINTLSELQAALPISISFSYRDEDFRDFDETKLVLARFDLEKNLWVPLPGSVVDASINEITAMTDQLSLFQVMMLAPGNSVSECKAFPNPLRPSQPGNEFLKFSSLPAGAKLTIYTLRGEMVSEKMADDQGNISWDAKNDNGEPVSSGVYFVLLDGSGGKTTLKVMVQR